MISAKSDPAHGFIIVVKDAIGVDVHAQRKIGVARRLHFDMNEHPAFDAGLGPNFDELIDILPPQLGLAHDLLKLLVKRFVAARPVDLRVNGRKQKREKCLEVEIECFLPRAVVVGGHGRLLFIGASRAAPTHHFLARAGAWVPRLTHPTVTCREAIALARDSIG